MKVITSNITGCSNELKSNCRRTTSLGHKVKGIASSTIIHEGLETNSCEITHCRKSLNSVASIQEFFASINKIFISAGGLGTRLLF